MFQPTALLVMEHNKTGLKYFCKTSQLHSLNKYKGSGKYWKKHLAKHGKDVNVGVLGIYYEEDRCRAAAKKFSEENDIVNSDAWANLIIENGIDGAPVGEKHPMWGKKHPQKGVKRSWVGKRGAENPMFGKPSPMRGKKNIGASKALKGRKRPEGGGKPSRAVICLTTKEEFVSVSEAARHYEGTTSTISGCCSGKSKTAYGMQWAYKEKLCQSV
jgi:hypothetical protein